MFEELFEKSEAALVVVDPEEQSIVRANRAARQLFQFEGTETRLKELALGPKGSSVCEVANRAYEFNIESMNISERGLVLLTGRRKRGLVFLEKQISEYRHRLELMFRQSIEGIFFMMLDEPVYWGASTDKEKALDYVFEYQRITEVNDAMLRQYNAKRSEFLNLTPADFFAHDIAGGRRIWRDFFDRGKLHIETEERTFDGSPIFVEGDYICLYDEKGRITGHFGIQREVTQKKKVELENEKSRKELDKLTTQLQDNIAAKDRFYSLLAHDLKNSFTRLLGYSELLTDTEEDLNEEEKDYYIQKLGKSVTSAYDMLEKLLMWGSTQTGRLKPRHEPINLTELFDQLVDYCSSVGADKNITIRKNIEYGLNIKGDREMLKTVFRNLLDNALKFTAQGGTVTVSAESGEREVSVSISDDGVGMSSEELDSLFVGGYRESRGTKHEPGTGLGLTVARDFIELHGGQVTVLSEKGQGSSFTVNLPLHEQARGTLTG